MLIEKNTLVNIVQPVCREYYVPMTSGRGFAGPSIWHKMWQRFRESQKERMALLIISDYDPEGFELADDAIRSLRDLWRVPIEGHRVAVTEDQSVSAAPCGDGSGVICRVGKGALRAVPTTYPHRCSEWWARFALPTLRSRNDGDSIHRIAYHHFDQLGAGARERR